MALFMSERKYINVFVHKLNKKKKKKVVIDEKGGQNKTCS